MASKGADMALVAALSMLVGAGCAKATAGPDESGDAEQARSQDPAAQREVGFAGNIEKLTEQNGEFRRVIYTGKNAQLVLMSIAPHDHIGLETHAAVDQFFRIEEGSGEAWIGSRHVVLAPGTALVVPAGTRHDIRNTGKKPLRLYTLYSPPNHRDGVVQHTREQAERESEHFDGVTTDDARAQQARRR